MSSSSENSTEKTKQSALLIIITICATLTFHVYYDFLFFKVSARPTINHFNILANMFRISREFYSDVRNIP